MVRRSSLLSKSEKVALGLREPRQDLTTDASSPAPSSGPGGGQKPLSCSTPAAGVVACYPTRSPASGPHCSSSLWILILRYSEPWWGSHPSAPQADSLVPPDCCLDGLAPNWSWPGSASGGFEFPWVGNKPLGLVPSAVPSPSFPAGSPHVRYGGGSSTWA